MRIPTIQINKIIELSLRSRFLKTAKQAIPALLKSIIRAIRLHTWQRPQFLAAFIACFLIFTISALFAFNEPVRKIWFKKTEKVFTIALPAELPVRYIKIPNLVPDSLDFCGEQVPLKNKRIYKKMRAAILENRSDATEMNLMARRSRIWFPVIMPILKRYHVPEDFKYIPLVETGFVNSVSPKGAAGFWQLMRVTAKDYGLKMDGSRDQRMDVTRSTIAACRYLRFLHSELGSWTLAAAAFNMGLGGLQHKVNLQSSSNYYSLMLNRETSAYIFRTVAIKQMILKQARSLPIEKGTIPARNIASGNQHLVVATTIIL